MLISELKVATNGSDPDYIPQYKLLDNNGKLVSFNILQFGNKAHNYNFEKPHRHNFYEILVFNRGGGTHDIDFTTYKAHDYSVHFVAAENVHMMMRSETTSGCILLFSDDFISRQLIEQLPFSKTDPVLKLDEADFIQINQWIENIKSEHINRQPDYEAIIRVNLQALMLYLLRAYHIKYPGEDAKSAKPKLIMQFIKLVKEHYIDHYNVETYAEMLNISVKHLITLCKLHIGKTPLRYIRDYTITEAKKLLFYTQLSVKEIAYQLNFDEPANFSKYFKMATTYTPLEYRRGINVNNIYG